MIKSNQFQYIQFILTVLKFLVVLNERDRDVHYNALVKPIDINFPIQESESQPD